MTSMLGSLQCVPQCVLQPLVCAVCTPSIWWQCQHPRHHWGWGHHGEPSAELCLTTQCWQCSLSSVGASSRVDEEYALWPGLTKWGTKRTDQKALFKQIFFFFFTSLDHEWGSEVKGKPTEKDKALHTNQTQVSEPEIFSLFLSQWPNPGFKGTSLDSCSWKRWTISAKEPAYLSLSVINKPFPESSGTMWNLCFLFIDVKGIYSLNIRN